MVATKDMPKQVKAADAPVGGEPPEEKPDTVKCYPRTKKKINQLGALLGLSQPEVFSMYEKYMDEDLLRELAKRQSELRQSRKA